eukprot:867469-Heterocapsa_arctica.AAC.1
MDKLPKFAGTSIPDAHVHVCRASEIVIDINQPFIFPLRAAKDKQERELALPPLENVPISEELLTEGTDEIEELPLLGNVTPVPEYGAPGTPENLFDDAFDTGDEAEPEAIPGPQGPVADLPSRTITRRSMLSSTTLLRSAMFGQMILTGRSSVTTASLGATKEVTGPVAFGQRSGNWLLMLSVRSTLKRLRRCNRSSSL